MQALLLFRLLLLAVLALPLAGQAEVRYQVTVVGGANSRSYDLNSTGQVVGLFDAGGANHAFLFNGMFTDLGTLGGASSAAFRINDRGQVVGTSDTPTTSAGFIYSGGTMTAIPTTWFSNAIGINNAGAVVGMQLVETPDGELDRHAYLYAGGVMTDLGTLPYGDNSQAHAINQAGRIVGQAANMVDGAPNYPQTSFYFRDGLMTDIGNFGGVWSAAMSINDLDQIVGYSGLAEPDGPELYPARAYLYSGGVMRNLGSLGAGFSSWAYDINNLGQVVGAGGTLGGQRGFLYEGGAMIDLNNLIDPASGWVISEAGGINDGQQIAATACRGELCYAVRLDLVNPVPEPATWAMLAGGLALLGCLRRRRSTELSGVGHPGQDPPRMTRHGYSLTVRPT